MSDIAEELETEFRGIDCGFAYGEPIAKKPFLISPL